MKNNASAKTPDPLWAVWGNGYGLCGPVKVYWNKQLNSWWSKCGNKDISGAGLVWTSQDSFHFADASLTEVKKFHRGYSTCAKIVRNAVSIN